ncbi:hypothetical protein SLEP1_g23134 [Rubroshorea leprosula]|uniref:Uncharacterized protein n=1 Tax=Rubroshorea leprosula TaxID=152421 RepID=A0AAV5JBB6_9ROSI|nr:hypothetical protein SLEP1_g23134 [Rubroshorea leprosula]
MEEEETRERQTHEEKARSPGVKRPREDGSSGDLGEDIVKWLLGDESDGESVAELLKQLECTESPTTWATTRVKFIDNPYSSQLIFQSSSSYITINGNEETCGSSFSDSDSSVMASVDMGGVVGANVKVPRGIEGLRGWFSGEGQGLLGANEAEARGWVVGGDGYDGGEGTKMNDCDGFDRDWDDVGLARFLGEDPFLNP